MENTPKGERKKREELYKTAGLVPAVSPLCFH